MTENEMGRRVPIIHENYWTESGRGDTVGQGDVWWEDHQSYQQPYIMMGNPRGKEEEILKETKEIVPKH